MIEREIVFDASGTRACMETPEGEFVCSRMTIHGDWHNPDSVTLRGVGKTKSFAEARIWVVLGIEPENKYD